MLMAWIFILHRDIETREEDVWYIPIDLCLKFKLNDRTRSLHIRLLVKLSNYPKN